MRAFEMSTSKLNRASYLSLSTVNVVTVRIRAPVIITTRRELLLHWPQGHCTRETTWRGVEASSKADNLTAIPLDELWKRHEFFDGLFRFYLEKVIDFHKFYLPIVGGVVAYVLANASRQSAFGLLIPLVVSIGAVWIFALARREAEELNGVIAANAKALGISATHARVLVHTVVVFLALHGFIVLGLSFGFVKLVVYGTL